MMRLVLVASMLAVAHCQTCVSDDRVDALSEQQLQGRTDIVKLSKAGMWKMAQLAMETSEEVLEDCGSCSEAEVVMNLPRAGSTNLTEVYYPFPRGAAQLKKSIQSNLEVRTNTKVHGFNLWDHVAAKKFAKDKGKVKKMSPLGLGKMYDDIDAENEDQSKFRSSATMKLAEYGTHIELLSRIQKESSSSDGLALILQDGTMVEQDFQDKLADVLQRVPKDFDLITMHEEGSMALRCEDKVAEKVYEMRRPIRTPDGKGEFYRGIEAYIVRKQSIPKILSEFQNLKADALDTMMMSVHDESADKKDGKTFYQSTGLYSYTVCGCSLIHRFQGNAQESKNLLKA